MVLDLTESELLALASALDRSANVRETNDPQADVRRAKAMGWPINCLTRPEVEQCRAERGLAERIRRRVEQG